MPQDYKHLPIVKETLTNDRRTRQFNPPKPERGNMQAHGQRLGGNLRDAVANARLQQRSDDSRLVLKIRYSGMFDFTKMIRHGVEFVSQEDKNICIVFASEKGLAEFADHLARLGINDDEMTYRAILEALDGIDNWTKEDRQSWAISTFGLPQTNTFKLDIELWPIQYSQHPERARLIGLFDAWLKEAGISYTDKVNLDSLLMYRVEVNEAQANFLLSHQDVRLVDLPPRTGVDFKSLDLDINDVPLTIPSPLDTSPKICILDSGINTNHPLLKSCIGEAVSFIDGESPEDISGHGTAVAGIAAYGDLEACTASGYWQPSAWIFSGKILKHDAQTGEPVFDVKTIEQTLDSAIQYFLQTYGCKIFNLSIGNLNAPYNNRHVRGMAYILDQLSRKHGILFIVSTGNFTGSTSPPVPVNSWREEYPDYLMNSQSVIIDPAPAMNVLTVGSLAKHTATTTAQRYPEINELCPASEDQPSPFTRHGPSVRGALKPEVVATGGNIATLMRRKDEQWKSVPAGLGVLTLNHNFIGKTLLSEMSGTSFAAPYITYLAARLSSEYPDASANMLRAMLVNHATVPVNCISTFDEAWRNQYRKENGWRELPREVCGYGKIDDDVLYRSSDAAVVLMAEESIENNAHQFFELPLPEDFLRSKRSTRELKVSFAYSPPVRTTRIEYLGTRMFFRLVRGNSLSEVQKHFNHDTQDDHEPVNDSVDGDRRSVSTTIRDKGTVQASTWTFKLLQPNTKWFVVVTRNDRDWGNALCEQKEKYSLVVTVTDHENIEATLYADIQLRLQEMARAREQERERTRLSL
ncbi:peptidase S8 [Pseudomonas silesiensis]|uniref:Peptidase S8 n=1 Tax=Pseudomonas silesiensis TaxID=1853130 RepID=A0A191Z1I8_9PSED|nr:S8 family peptidase [Pseudomonas silesiensis]ANJ59050.1 peptidase S8 [Pseudomonas silesiensis]